jgi:nicotinate-nucleotide pyrophosphorylase (carboxylating)
VKGKTVLQKSEVLDIIRLSLREDIGGGDITTDAIFSGTETSAAVIIAKEDGIFCGGGMAAFIYEEVDPDVKTELLINDGKKIKDGDTAVRIKGKTRSLLIGERTVLNFVQRMSGIATKTSGICSLIKGSGIKLLDTRKTAPGHRVTDKYSVRMGGGWNHRAGLFDMVLIKDNHIKAAGGIREAVEKVRKAYKKGFQVEVEASNLREVEAAADSGVDIIMLDNMSREMMLDSIAIIGGRAKIEVSGNIDADRIKELIGMGIDYVSMGALTHSVNAFDLSMKFI